MWRKLSDCKYGNSMHFLIAGNVVMPATFIFLLIHGKETAASFQAMA